jgi:D-tyrosyl-tRNA(Tyr) deacylase
MRVIIQRVLSASVTIDSEVVAEIDNGFLVLLGITHDDDSSDIDFLVNKVANLRVFEDDNEKMNLSLLDVEGSALVVSQFTLYGDCRKGRRPSFVDAARPEIAEPLYNKFVEELKKLGIRDVQTGQFGAEMKVGLVNDGPVTILINSPK